MLLRGDKFSSVNFIDPKNSKDCPSSLVDSDVNFRSHVEVPKDFQFFKSSKGRLSRNTMSNSTLSLPSMLSRFEAYHPEPCASQPRRFMKNFSVNNFTAPRIGKSFDVVSTKSDTAGFRPLRTNLDHGTPKSVHFKLLGTPTNSNPKRADFGHRSFDQTRQPMVRTNEIQEVKMETDPVDTIPPSSNNIHSLFQSSRLPTPNAFPDPAQLGAPQAVVVEEPPVTKTGMKREESWASIEQRLFGESQEHLYRASSSASSERSYGSLEPTLTTKTLQLDRHPSIGGSFSKLLNTMSWLASMELSCKEYQKNLKRNFSNSNLSISTLNDSVIRNYAKPSPPSYPFNYTASRVSVSNYGQTMYTPSNPAPGSVHSNSARSSNEDCNMDSVASIDNDFNMDHNYNCPTLHFNPPALSLSSHSAKEPSVAAQSSAGSEYGRNNSYRGKYFYNNRVVNGVEQEVYDLDVDLGITNPRKNY